MTSAAAHPRRPTGATWRPDQLPPRGQIRTDGTTYAIYLPLSLTDPTPWHVVSRDHTLMQTVTHAVVYSASWRALPTLVEILANPPARPAAPVAASARLFFPGDPCPDDLAAVLTPDRTIWEASQWRAADASITWDDLLAAYRGAIEVPVQQLMASAYIQQQRRVPASPAPGA